MLTPLANVFKGATTLTAYVALNMFKNIKSSFSYAAKLGLGYKTLEYTKFEVIDEDVANRILDWDERNTKARQEIDNFIHSLYGNSAFRLFNLPGCRKNEPLLTFKPFFKLDNDGYISHLSYNGNGINATPKGWGMDRSGVTQLMVPVEDEAIKSVKALTAVPSYKELADIIGFPCFEPAKGSSSRLQNEIAKYNNAPYVEKTHNDQIHIFLPNPSNYNHIPMIRDALLEWGAIDFPSCLTFENQQNFEPK